MNSKSLQLILLFLTFSYVCGKISIPLEYNKQTAASLLFPHKRTYHVHYQNNAGAGKGETTTSKTEVGTVSVIELENYANSQVISIH